MKNNLIQNFYIIGLPPEDIIQLYNSNDNIISENLNDFLPQKLIPKIITKFPPIENYNSVFDEIVIEQCFPNGFEIVEFPKKEEPKSIIFSFELDNTIFKYITNYQFLYSKIHFTCLEFFEKIDDYNLFLHEISKNLNNNNEIKENSMNNFYIPKIICFGSLLPFNTELSNILIIIYEYFIKQSSSKCQNNLNLLPLEKIIEQIVMCLPLPVSYENEVNISFELANSKNSLLLPSTKIINWKEDYLLSLDINFPCFNQRFCHMNNLYDYSLIETFSFFTVEDIVKIFKYIILEIPILFFNQNIGVLSMVIEGFLSLLLPFKYVLPYTTVLPNKYYRLINNEPKFIFGINKEYNPDFFKKNDILLDKTIIVVILKTNKKSKVEEILPKQEELKDYIIIDDRNIFTKNSSEMFLPNGMKIELNNIEFPLKRTKKLIWKIKEFLADAAKKESTRKNKYEQPDTRNNNSKIRFIFYKFFLKLLEGYTDYSRNINYEFFYGDNIRYKMSPNSELNININNLSKNNVTPFLFIKEIFNMDEYISKFPKDSQKFYKNFFNTKLFLNFIRQKIYLTNELDVVNYKIFDLLSFLKKHKDARKKMLYMKFYNIFKKSVNSTKPQTKPSILLNISYDYNFISDEKKLITQGTKIQTALEKYAQIIKSSPPYFSIKYFLFPKLLFDNEFFEINYKEQFYKHFLELPTNAHIKNLDKKLRELEKSCNDEIETLINPSNDSIPSRYIGESFQNNKNFISRTSKEGIYRKSFEILIDDYIEINWLLLISCSLWYCNKSELDSRINKIFDILEKIDYIEEQVLSFLYISLYKYGNKTQFIKMYEYLFKFLDYSTYTNLSLLYTKITQKDKENKIVSDNKEKKSEDNKNHFKFRSFFDIKKILKNENQNAENNSINIIDNKNNNDNIKEEITFYTMQKCDKCGQKNDINIAELIHHRTRKNQNKLLYKCSECQEELSIFIKYDIILNNRKKNKNEGILITNGKFKLIPPSILYQQIKNYIMYLKDFKLDINHIFSNDKINLLNFIFYFSHRTLPFDFLLPYVIEENEINSDRDYFENEEEENEEDDEIDGDNKVYSVYKNDDVLISENMKENNINISGKES